MKKIFLSMFAALSVFGATATDPNRIILHPEAGSTIAMRTDRVKEITFATVEGPVVATAKVLQVGAIGAEEALTVSVTMSEDCKSYKYVLVPEAVVSQYNDAAMAAYIDMNSPEVMYEGFESAALQGITLDPSTNYVFSTLAFDGTGAACDVSMARFSTPDVDLIGDPKCTYNVDKVGLFSAEVTITPNKDVAGWACVLFEKDGMKEQFETFAPMFGFANYGQMIKAWGINSTGERVVSWNDLAPNTDYEVAIQAWDVENHYAPMTMCNFSTKALGGTGNARVEVELGDYVLADWNDQMLPSQYVTYMPDSECARYRFGVYLKAQYDQDPETCKNNVAQEPPMPNMANWWFFDEMTTDYQINPGTEFVVITAAQNINNEWGDIDVHHFTTPAEAPKGARAEAKAVTTAREIATRIAPTVAVKGGTVPAMRLVRK